MTSQGHVTTASLKQAHEDDNREVFFIGLYLKKFCASILETSHSKFRDAKQDDVNVECDVMFDHDQTNSHRVKNKRFGVEECWSYIK